MEIFRKLFGRGSKSPDTDKSGLYFYVKSNTCDEIVRVRIDVNNDLSLTDDGSGYWVRKLVHGTNYRCRWPLEMTLFFSSDRRLQSSDVQGGTLVTREEYESWVAHKG